MSDKSQDDDFFELMRKRFKLAEEALVDIHREALLDFKFRVGDQWDPTIETRRKQGGRPCYTINRIPQFLRQLTGEQKKSRPAIEISPIGDGADVETAEIEQGLVRHIERASNAAEAYDTAFDHCATGGFGFFRLVTEYVDDDGFDQEIKFQRELNPFSHYPDPRCKEADYSDAEFWFVVEDVLREDYERLYPDSEITGLQDFASEGDRAPGWLMTDSVRVAEYFYVDKTRKKLKHGKREREVEVRQVCWIKTNGLEKLETAEIPGKYIPIIPVLGEDVRVEDKRHLIGLVRYQRTPQQLYNLWQSAMAEAIALAPKSPFLATPAQIEGHEEIWEQANNESFPYLPVNPDPKAPGWPERNSVEPPIQAIQAAIQHADNDLHETTGLYPPSLGEGPGDQSGKAILLRQKQGDTALYGLLDSMATAIKHAGRIIIGWVPTYYDAPRVVRIVHPDGESETVPINKPFQDDAGLRKVFDLTVGRYDVAVSQGPSYDAMREEAAQSMLQLVQANPALMQVIGDLLVQNFDWPMAKEVAERLKKLLPPALQDAPGQVPPQAQAQMAQQSAMIQQLTQVVHQMSAKLEGQQVQAASRERIALLQAKAGIIEAALKAKSQEAIVAFQADLEQIDRQLGQIPDPALGLEAGMQAGQQRHESQMQSSQQSHERLMATQAQQAAQQQQQAAAEQQQNQPKAA